MTHFLNEYYDNIYVLYINDKELNRIKNKLEPLNIKVEYFEGVNGYTDTINYSNYLHNYKNKELKPLNCGSYGHTMSFSKIISDAKNKGFSKILILEPDIYFCEDFDSLCSYYLQKDYVKNAKLVYFGASQNKFYTEETWNYIDKHYDMQMFDGYYYAHYTLGTFAISIDNSIYEECLQILELKEMPTDVALLKIHSIYPKKCIVIYPNIICCDVSDSKTSNKKNQIDSIKKLRWDRDYQFIDHWFFKVEVGYRYIVEITVDSFFPDWSIELKDIMTVNKDTDRKKISGKVKDNIYLHFISTEIDVELVVNNLFGFTKITKIGKGSKKLVK